MKKKSLFLYFFKGFSLVNQSIDLLLIKWLLSIPVYISIFFMNTFIGILFSWVYTITACIGLGFALSLPLFFIQKQKKEKLDYRKVVAFSVKNALKILLPFLLLLVLLVVVFVGFVLIVTILFPLQGSYIFETMHNFNKNLSPLGFIPVILFSFVTFTSFIFSLEKKGLIASVIKSVAVSCKHPQFIAIVSLLEVASYSIIRILPRTTIWGYFIGDIFYLYIGFIITASALFYYQQVIKKENV